MKSLWFPDPDRHKFRRDAYESRDYEREIAILVLALFLSCAILWLGVLAIDLGWIWKGWITL